MDPHGSILAEPAELNTSTEQYQVEGIGYDFVPGMDSRGNSNHRRAGSVVGRYMAQNRRPRIIHNVTKTYPYRRSPLRRKFRIRRRRRYQDCQTTSTWQRQDCCCRPPRLVAQLYYKGSTLAVVLITVPGRFVDAEI